GEALLVEATTGYRQDCQSQHELQIPALLHSDSGVDPLMHAWDKVRTHLQDEHRQGQDKGQDKVPLEPGLFGIAPFARLIHRLRSGIDTAGFITCCGHSLDQEPGLCHASYGGAFGGQVDRGLGYARNSEQRFFYAADTRCAVHALHFQLDDLGRYVVTRLLDGMDQCHFVNVTVSPDLRSFGGQIHRNRIDAFDFAQSRLDPAHTARTIHSLNGKAYYRA